METALPAEKGTLPAALAPLISALKGLGLSKDEMTLWRKSAESYAHFAKFFAETSDPSALLGEDNDFYYLPKDELWLFVEEECKRVDLLRVVAACIIVGVPLLIFSPKAICLPKLKGVTTVFEGIREFAHRIREQQPKELRLFSPPPTELARATGERGVLLLQKPVYASGRLELLNYLQERVLSHRTHRYGYVT